MRSLAVGDCGVCIGGWDGDPAEFYDAKVIEKTKMKSTGWKAEAMPIVFWSVPAADWTDNPRLVDLVEGMDAEVTLPNGQIVIVDEVRYQGINGGAHHWQGRVSRGYVALLKPAVGRAGAGHTFFNCVACGTVRCQSYSGSASRS
jgi:hypothetical protein